jgi:GT2 family glycosyltransferase
MTASGAQSGAPLVSIVVPCHLSTAAQQELLRETLDSAAAQSCRDLEVIVVDDGSTVDVETVVSARPNMTYVRQANAGPAVARNTGIAASRAPHLVFLDADDLLLPRALDSGLAALDAHPEAGFVVGPREEMTFEGEPVDWPVPIPPARTQLYATLLGFDWYIIPPSSAMFRREVVAAVGGFRDPWGPDDLDFYLRVARQHTAWCYQAPAVTRYRRYSTSTSRDGERMLHGIRTVYDRQRPFVCGDRELEAAFNRGLQRLTSIFVDCLVENIDDRIRSGNRLGALRSARLLARENPALWQSFLEARGAEAQRLAAELEPTDNATRGTAAM